MSRRRVTAKTLLRDELRAQEEAAMDCDRDKFWDLLYSMELLDDEYDLICKKIIDDSAQERLDIWREKEKDVGQLEKEYKHRRRQISTGVLCSQNVATCIAEYISGDPARLYFLPITFSEDLYCFSVAIRATGEEWQYLVNAAVEMAKSRTLRRQRCRIEREIDGTTARALIGELCRLDRSIVGSYETFRCLPFYDGYFSSAEYALLEGILRYSIEWFKGSYLRNPFYLPLRSTMWKRRLLEGHDLRCRICNPLQDKLVEYMEEAFQLPIEKEKPWLPLRK